MTRTDDQPILSSVSVSESGAPRDIAVLHRSGSSPGVMWLGGFMSDMEGSKAEALDRWAGRRGRACTRFDYSGHGRSSGAFEDGTISRWLDEAAAVFHHRTSGPVILIGSSMGGWIALLLAKRLQAEGEPGRLGGMVLIAPAVDMTAALMWDRFGADIRHRLQTTGVYHQPSDYSEEPYPITHNLIEDGRKHLFGGAPISCGCPVHIIQGMQDTDVPWRHATALLEQLAHDDAVLTLVRDGDHRLSRPQDLDRLIRTVESLSPA